MVRGKHDPSVRLIRDIGENALIERIARWTGPRDGAAGRGGEWARMEVVCGLGDDAAVVRAAGCADAPGIVLTADMLVENVHFLPDHPAEDLGYKALASNLSDLAAMGAAPVWFLVSLGAPGETPVDWVRGFYRGMGRAARPYGCLCLGGDCVRAPVRTIGITAGGACASVGRAPRRDAARPGMALYATGTLGDSGAGLRILQDRAAARMAGRDAGYLVRRHRRPTARVEAGAAIARLCPDAAMMDLSDGLAADLPRMAGLSGCGFHVRLGALPISPALGRFAGALGEAAYGFALFGGEDYELLFATAEPEENWVDGVAGAAPGRRLRVSRIGEAVAGCGVRYLDARGRPVDVGAGGFEHYGR